MNLIEKNVLETSDEEISKRFKEYFDEIVPKFNITQNECNIQKQEASKIKSKKVSVLV